MHVERLLERLSRRAYLKRVVAWTAPAVVAVLADPACAAATDTSEPSAARTRTIATRADVRATRSTRSCGLDKRVEGVTGPPWSTAERSAVRNSSAAAACEPTETFCQSESTPVDRPGVACDREEETEEHTEIRKISKVEP